MEVGLWGESSRRERVAHAVIDTINTAAPIGAARNIECLLSLLKTAWVAVHYSWVAKRRFTREERSLSDEGVGRFALEVVTLLAAKPRTLLTLLTGAEPPPLDGLVERIAAAHPELEVEVHEGGQPHYPLLLGAE